MGPSVQFLRLLGVIVRLWHRRELIRVRRSFLFAGLVLPLIILGAFSEPWFGLAGKAIWLLTLAVLATILCLTLTYFRAPFGLEVGTAAATAGQRSPATGPEQPRGRTRRAARKTIEGADTYIRFVMAFVASEIAACFIAFLPVHRSPIGALFLLLAAMLLVAHGVWQGKKLTLWPRLVYALGVVLVVVALAVVLIPQTAADAASYGGGFDGWARSLLHGIVAAVRGDAESRTMFWVILALLAIQAIIAAMVAERVRSIFRKVSLLAIVAVLVAWFIWGAGATVVTRSIGSDAVAVAPFPGVQRIEVSLRPGVETPVGHLLRGGWCYAVRQGTAKNLRLQYMDGDPESFGQRHVGWRELRGLIAEGGSAVIEIYKPTAGSCRPEDAA